jgi:deazaflavin-dependent oxidoreductase (nitroreductase family)
VSKSIFDRSTVDLIHSGRKTAKPYKVKIWFVVLDGKVWIGSLSPQRNWVRNLRAAGRAELDFAGKRLPIRARYTEDDRDIERFAAAVVRKYPVTSRLLNLFYRGKRCAFETDLAARA